VDQVVSKIALGISFEDGPAAGQVLRLRRAPLFLRVTYDAGGDVWDGLDQLGDVPNSDEQIYVYERVGPTGVMMVDGTGPDGRRKGWQILTGEYRLYPQQPAEDVLRDNAAWQAWCLQVCPLAVRPAPSSGAAQPQLFETSNAGVFK
jgi:hypothetical protein